MFKFILATLRNALFWIALLINFVLYILRSLIAFIKFITADELLTKPSAWPLLIFWRMVFLVFCQDDEMVVWEGIEQREKLAPRFKVRKTYEGILVLLLGR